MMRIPVVMKKFCAVSQLTKILSVISFIVLSVSAFGQKDDREFPFSIRLEPHEIKGFPALQSFVCGEWQGKWVFMGGRLDGLHRRQPFASFDAVGQNSYIYVVDPVAGKVWKRTVKDLPVTIAEQLLSSNMQFYQDRHTLYMTGGYGFSKTADDHTTFPFIISVDVHQLVTAIMQDEPIAGLFSQLKDERMAITGGRMGMLGDTLLLAGGQRFEGRYNPHGPDHGPGFVQQYSNEIRKFIIDTSKANVLTLTYYSAIRDSVNLHRRDYNMVPQVLVNNKFAYTMFSGVFQYDEDLPYTNFVDVVNGSYEVNNTFIQRFSHYHSAVLPLYDPSNNFMYSIFFGGIAQYYPDAKGKIINDKDVPFTKTISVVMRGEKIVKEIYLPVQMPGYLGASAEFMYASPVVMYANGIANTSFIQSDEVLIGYVVGGINSGAKNIFWENTGQESKASSSVIKVYIKRKRSA